MTATTQQNNARQSGSSEAKTLQHIPMVSRWSGTCKCRVVSPVGGNTVLAKVTITPIYKGEIVSGEALANLFAAAPELLDALKLLWAFIDDVGKSNPGWMGKLCLQNYGQMNEAYLKTERVLAKLESKPI